MASPSLAAYPLDGSVIRFPGSVLRAEAVFELVDVLSLQANGPGRHVLLDLTDVEYPTAGGLGQLVAMHAELLMRGAELVLCGVSEKVYEVFEVTRLTERLDVRR